MGPAFILPFVVVLVASVQAFDGMDRAVSRMLLVNRAHYNMSAPDFARQPSFLKLTLPTLHACTAGQGSITVPGCLAATPIEAPIDVEEVCACLSHCLPFSMPACMT